MITKKKTSETKEGFLQQNMWNQTGLKDLMEKRI